MTFEATRLRFRDPKLRSLLIIIGQHERTLSVIPGYDDLEALKTQTKLCFH